ncbi:hypothetical protein V6N13_012508 [Hibiscus sabdariffa]|uniref:Uncharacterized protein n=1 Tax=Hibiscus sabdariffa TaxID=183260 RepID=A0ABR2SFF1_9ROSI
MLSNPQTNAEITIHSRGRRDIGANTMASPQNHDSGGWEELPQRQDHRSSETLTAQPLEGIFIGRRRRGYLLAGGDEPITGDE